MVKLIKTETELNEMKIRNGGIIPYSFYEGEIYFLFGREAKDNHTEDRALWGEFGGLIEKNKESNLDGIVREFWEETNGMFGTIESIRGYIKNNFEKLLVAFVDTYEGVFILMPIEYDKKYVRMYYTTYILHKHILDTKKEIQRARKRGLLEKDQIQWYSYNELGKSKKRFRKSNHDIIQLLLDTFNVSNLLDGTR